MQNLAKFVIMFSHHDYENFMINKLDKLPKRLCRDSNKLIKMWRHISQ